MAETSKCPVCSTDGAKTGGPGEIKLLVDCPRCGKFWVPDTVLSFELKNLDEIKITKLSGWIKEQNRMGDDPLIKSYNLEEILKIRIPPIPERIRRFLKLAVEKIPSYYDSVNWTDPDFISMTYSRDIGDVEMLVDYLLDKKFIKHGSSSGTVKITTEGYIKNEEWNKSFSESVQGFVALWFNEEMTEAWDKGFKPAIEEAGYDAVRIDLKQFNGDINDKIIAEVRRSRFVVADFTGQRGGVYFEAGFAKGLDLEVFWTCSEKHKDEIHFDINHFNFIFWKDAKDLKKQLKDRISAVIGDGPNRP